MKATLPKPPSINHIYGYSARGGYARSYITKEGKDWFENAGKLLKKQWKKRKMMEEQCEVWVELHTSRRQDVDNIAKPLLDLLVKTGYLKDDSLIYKLDIEKFKVKRDEEKVIIDLFGS